MKQSNNLPRLSNTENLSDIQFKLAEENFLRTSISHCIIKKKKEKDADMIGVGECKLSE